MVFAPLEAGEDNPTLVGGPVGTPIETLCPNPACRQPLGPDTYFCQACGTEVAATAPPEPEKPRAWFALATILWLLLAVGGFLFLYANAFVLGRT
jgi:hypothetical protein